MRHRIILILIILQVALILNPACSQETPNITVATIDDEITYSDEVYIREALRFANSENSTLFVLLIDTPGGVLTNVEEIMKMFDSSPIPVLVYVTPTRAASGGAYILLASHIAAMKPGAVVGSAQPISSSGEPIKDAKFINYLTGLMKEHASLHSRNETVAELFVTQNLNLGAFDAQSSGIIEFASIDLDSLLTKLEEYALVLSQGVFRLVDLGSVSEYQFSRTWTFSNVSKARRLHYDQGLSVTTLKYLTNPTITYLMLQVGLWALFFGFLTPGMGLEIVGAVALLLAIIGLGYIGIDVASLLLFGVGIVFLIIEVKTNIGFQGGAAILGAIAIILGSLLILPTGRREGWSISLETVRQVQLASAALSAVVGGFFGFAFIKVLEVKKSRVRAGIETIMKSRGVVKSRLSPNGIVLVRGEEWSARSLDGEIGEGEKVVVVAVEGLTLLVKRSLE